MPDSAGGLLDRAAGRVWTPLQRRLMDAMPGERIVPKSLAVPGRSCRAGWLRPGSTGSTAGENSPLAFLLAPESGRSPFPPRVTGVRRRSSSSPVDLFHAGGREAEIEEVFRRILATGAPLDQVEIACASDAHVALVWEKALRHDWPVTLGPGIAAPSTRPGRALIGFCDWIETDFSAGHLRRLLQSGDIALDEDEDGFTAGQAARTLARAEAGWGRATYRLALEVLQRSYETRANDPDLADEDREAAQKKAALTARIKGWITQLDRGGAARIGRQGTAAGSRGRHPVFPRTLGARTSQLDHRAAAALDDYVSELRALGAFQCSLGEALRFIRERVRVAAGGRRASASRSPLRLPAAAGRIRRPPAPLRRRARRRPRVSGRDGRSRAARRRADRHLARAAALDRPDRRGGVRSAQAIGRAGGDNPTNVGGRRTAASRSATHAATRASSARPMPRG